MKDPQEAQQKQQKKYQKLSEEWRQNQIQNSEEQLRAELQKTAIDDYGNSIALEMDPDINNLKEQLKVASTPYRDIAKINKIKVAFIVEVLEGRGADVPSYASLLKKAAKESLD